MGLTLVLSAAFFTLGYIARAFMRACNWPKGRLLYSIYLGDENQAIVFKHAESTEIVMIKPDLERVQRG